VPLIEHAASADIVDVWKQSAADLRPTGGREDNSPVQHDATPTLSLQWTMIDCLRESPAQYTPLGVAHTRLPDFGSLSQVVSLLTRG
jgi:hypothetical protein